jgi:hypothetical protein
LQGEEEEEEGPVLPAEPAVPLDAAREAVARFTAKNPRNFGSDVKFMFEKKIANPLQKMMIGRLRNRGLGSFSEWLWS